MRLVDLVLDLSALVKASGSVAAKHVALCKQQLDASGRLGSVAATWKEVKPTAAQSGPKSRRDRPGVDNADHDRRTEQPSTTTTRQNGIQFTETGATQSEIRDGPQRNPGPTFSRGSRASEAASELNAPPGVDLNIFHTARGASIFQPPAKSPPHIDRLRPSTHTPVKEHPLRYWPLKAPSSSEDRSSVSLDAHKKLEGIDSVSSIGPSPPRQAEDANKPAVKPEPKDANSTSPVQLDATSSPLTVGAAADIPSSCNTSVEKDFVGAVQDASISQSSSLTTYQLRESKVPASRLNRLWNYGGLAAGMLGGAMTESVSRAFGGGGQGSVLLSGQNMERLVAKLSRMRGAALKLGQMMSFQDSKMLPAPIQQVLQRVQDRADYMPAWQRDRVLTTNLGDNWRDFFSDFVETPIAAASIGQVHKAVLKSNGRRVAVKVQFPGVAASIDSDLDNLGILLNATKLLPRGLYLNKTIDNARVELGWECDYEREAQCAKRYKDLLPGDEDVFIAPDVYTEASGKQVLTMDFMDGIGVTRVKSFDQQQRDWIGTQIMRLCLREIFEFRFMQTDPNWTNFQYNAAVHKLELLDFGASREYSVNFIRQYVQLLEAASRADREDVRALSQRLGYLTGLESKAMVNAHIDSVLTIAEPFRKSVPTLYDFRDQTITERVKALIPLMLRERLSPPPEETYSLHRKLSGAFLLCARLGSKVPCRELFAIALAKSDYVRKDGA